MTRPLSAKPPRPGPRSSAFPPRGVRGGLAAVLVLSATAVAADDSTASAEELRSRLSELQKQLAEERAAVKREKAERAKELAELKSKRRSLAENVLELEATRRKLTERRKALTNKVEKVRSRAATLEDAVGSMRSAAVSALEQLGIRLREVPATKERRKRARALQEKLTGDGATADALDRLLAWIDTAHRRATHVTVERTRLWTAAERRERVTLLRVGHAAFAYETADGRVGVALNSPADASGYRWREDLPEYLAGRLREAIDAVEGGDSRTVAVPMDISGKLRADTALQRTTPLSLARSGGPIMVPLGLVALVGLLLVVERCWVLYVRNTRQTRLVRRVLEACRAKRFDDAERACRRGRGAVARTLAAPLTHRHASRHVLEDTIQEQLMHELPRLQRFLGGIAVVASVAPLLGLLGTVTGIIQTFGVIRAFGSADPGLMAGGISEALVTTATGLTVAIPILLLHSLLRGRVDRLVSDAEKHAATVLNLVETGGEGDATVE